ncbi:uncharacterized protein PV09_09695 [Verruconis gallopava]|uniref:Uncharacterized protein n=1 Tax=Verruconis gallopava TaxID=253628 RepID=A0A0D1YCV5_9PEZI|nr:uncharacterized protein PV09_09695 [Verruconis gallopava]KIV98491.1 hypothetical protein PV09_09695 [Verruconis gallopava]
MSLCEEISNAVDTCQRVWMVNTEHLLTGRQRLPVHRSIPPQRTCVDSLVLRRSCSCSSASKHPHFPYFSLSQQKRLPMHRCCLRVLAQRRLATPDPLKKRRSCRLIHRYH